MNRSSDQHDRPMHWPRLYELNLWLLGRRARRLYEAYADRLGLATGDRVLDVGCGTGRLAVVLAGRVGPSGSVIGVDPAEEMVRRSRSLAVRRSVPATFEVARAQRLPFADAEFDAVACTLALHHVAQPERQPALVEMYRVLRPGGRLLVADFAPTPGHNSWFLRRHHGEDVIAAASQLAAEAGFTDLAVVGTDLGWLGTLTGTKPSTPDEQSS